jgi:hypothetical protein
MVGDLILGSCGGDSMNAEEFNDALRRLVRRKPFLPFFFVMRDGKTILVDLHDAVSFDGGAAGFIGPDEIHFIRCEDVQELRTIVPEPVA